MSHLYPLATSAIAALHTAEHAALNRAEADRLAGVDLVLALETEWLTLSVEEAETATVAATASVGQGFVQYYENADGAVVLAVTYWKLAAGEAEIPGPDLAVSAPATPAPEEDHTDDLYFRFGRTKKRARRKKENPNQMDLFCGPKKD